MSVRAFSQGNVWGTRVDSPATPVKFATLQDIQIDIKGTLADSFGTGKFAEAVAVGKCKVSGTATLERMDPYLFTSLFLNQLVATGNVAVVKNEAVTVTAGPTLVTSAATPSGNVLTFTATTGVVKYVTATSASLLGVGATVASSTGTTVTLSVPDLTTVPITTSIVFGPSYAAANAATFATDLGVTYSLTGVPLTWVAPGTAPALGQYTVDPTTGKYVFSVADIGAALLINYGYTVTTGNQFVIAQQDQGVQPVFSLTANTSFTGILGLEYVTIQLYACVSESLGMAFKMGAFENTKISFEAMVNAAGNLGSLSFSK